MLDEEELKRARWTGIISVQSQSNPTLPVPVLILDDMAIVVASIKRKRARSDSDTFLFDPRAFQEANKNARIEQYQLTDEELHEWAT